MVKTHNIAINHRAFGTGLKTATRFTTFYSMHYRHWRNKMKIRLYALLVVLFVTGCGTNQVESDLPFLGGWRSLKLHSYVEFKQNEVRMFKYKGSNLLFQARYVQLKKDTWTVELLNKDGEIVANEKLILKPKNKLAFGLPNLLLITYERAGNIKDIAASYEDLKHLAIDGNCRQVDYLACYEISQDTCEQQLRPIANQCVEMVSRFFGHVTNKNFQTAIADYSECVVTQHTKLHKEKKSELIDCLIKAKFEE